MKLLVIMIVTTPGQIASVAPWGRSFAMTVPMMNKTVIASAAWQIEDSTELIS